MLGLAARLIGGMITPLIDKVSASSARLLRKLALFVVAGLALVVVGIALTMAFELWVASRAGHIAGALAVAGLYFTIAIIAVALALWGGKSKTQSAEARDSRPGTTKPGAGRSEGAADRSGLDSQVDAFAAPLLNILAGLGLRREQLAVLAGTSLAKQIGPVPLVALAIVAGFLIGRMAKGWKSLVPTDLVSSLLSADILSTLLRTRGADPDDTETDA